MANLRKVEQYKLNEVDQVVFHNLRRYMCDMWKGFTFCDENGCVFQVDGLSEERLEHDRLWNIHAIPSGEPDTITEWQLNKKLQIQMLDSWAVNRSITGMFGEALSIEQATMSHIEDSIMSGNDNPRDMLLTLAKTVNEVKAVLQSWK